MSSSVRPAAKAIQKRPRQTFSTSRIETILSGKHAERHWRFKPFVQLRDEQLTVIIQQSIQTFQDWLRCQVKFVEKKPAAAFDHR
jgi:hypothetical protein